MKFELDIECEMFHFDMCIKKDCPSFDHCYRAQAKPNDIWQTYQEFDNGDKDKCDSYKEFYLDMPKFLRIGND